MSKLISERGTLSVMSEEKQIFESGAQRSNSADGHNFRSISPHALRRLAARHNMGDTNYGEGNWLKGIPYSSIIEHFDQHWNDFKLNRCKKDDNLAAIAWAVFTLMHYEETGRTELDDYIHGQESSDRLTQLIAEKSKKN